MDLIIDFYKGLDALDLIIFWGIIIVIILLLILAFILINKNKKLKKIVEKNTNYEEELPIKKEEFNQIKEKTEEPEIVVTIAPSEGKELNSIEENTTKQIEVENNFVVEEHVLEYNKDADNTSNINKTDENQAEQKINEINPKSTIEIPTKPYQRNVLREMSLSQTSPIGINRQTQQETRKIEIVKDLEESLSNEELNVSDNKDATNQLKSNTIETAEYKMNIKDDSYIKKEEKSEIPTRIKDEPKEISELNNIPETPAKELLINQTIINDHKKESNASGKYLEEVSRKLSEAEIPDEVERTTYELQQEEDAIISYKELMEKKDSIQTIDEEEAIISIEELMNRTSKKQEDKETSKLYNLSEEEENDSFIKELKQFRNDL